MADAEVALRKLLDQTLDDLQYKPREVALHTTNSGGGNYTTALFTIDVTSPGKDDLHLFAKVAIVEGMLREEMAAEDLYKTEDLFYNKLMKYYELLQQEHGVPEEHRIVFPKLYACSCVQGEETFIFDNLNKQGFDMYSRLDSVDFEHAAAAISNLAKFHALSFAFEREYPEEFREIAVPRPFRQVRSESRQSFIENIKNNVGAIEDVELMGRVGRFLQEETTKEGAGSKRGDFMRYYGPLGTNVIVHGDYRVSNVMYKREEGKLSSIILDYQLVHGGCPVSDIMYFVSLGSDEEFRRQHFDELLQHYHEELTLALRRLHLDVADVYPREQFDKEVNEAQPFALVAGLVILPMVTVEAASAPNILGKDAELSRLILKPNELYKRRFNGIVRDCASWGVI